MNPLVSKTDIIGKYFWLWPLFCLQAGLINSGGFLATSQFVSHVTGFGTRVGVEFGQKEFFLGLEMLLIPVGFILGSAVGGFFQEVRNNRFETPFFLITILLSLVTWFGWQGSFGTFGEPLVLQRDFALLAILCFSCGLQNSTIAAITGGAVRTTHMTGISTDIGLSIAKSLSRKFPEEKKWLKLRWLKLLFFSSGAALGTLIFQQHLFLGFAVPAILNLVLFFFLYKNIKGKISLSMYSEKQASL